MKEQFRQVQILYLALLIGQLSLFGVAFFMSNQEPQIGEATEGSIFATLVPALLIGALGVVYFVTKSKKQQATKLNGLDEKLPHYRQTVILRGALLEGANLIAIVAILVEGEVGKYLPYFVVGLLAFLFFYPSIGRFTNEYKLSASEEQSLR